MERDVETCNGNHLCLKIDKRASVGGARSVHCTRQSYAKVTKSELVSMDAKAHSQIEESIKSITRHVAVSSKAVPLRI